MLSLPVPNKLNSGHEETLSKAKAPSLRLSAYHPQNTDAPNFTNKILAFWPLRYAGRERGEGGVGGGKEG